MVTGVTSILMDLAGSNTKLAASQKQFAALNTKLAKSRKQVASMSNWIASRSGAKCSECTCRGCSLYWHPCYSCGYNFKIFDACPTTEYRKEINRVLNRGTEIDAETTCAIKVSDKDTVIKTFQNSSKAQCESGILRDISFPSFSKVTATTMRARDGSINGFSSVWNWLFKN